MNRRSWIILALVPFVVSGCMVRTALDVATAPVRVAGKAVDLATTSQDESDLKRGRNAREAEERAEKQERKARKRAKKCQRDPDDCD